MSLADPLARTRDEGCLSDLVLDRLLAGELDGKDASVTAEKHLADCPRCSERLASLRAESRKFPEEVWIAGAALKAKKAAAASRARWIAPVGAIAVAMAAGLAAVTLKPTTQLASATASPGIQIKGDDIVELAVLHPDGKQELFAAPPARLSADDKVEFLVTANRSSWTIVLDVDSQTVTPFPESGPVQVPQLRKTQLGTQSFVLDANPGPERFIALFCDDPTAVAAAPEAIRRSLSASQNPAPPAGCRQTVFPIVKVPRTP